MHTGLTCFKTSLSIWIWSKPFISIYYVSHSVVAWKIRTWGVSKIQLKGVYLEVKSKYVSTVCIYYVHSVHKKGNIIQFTICFKKSWGGDKGASQALLADRRMIATEFPDYGQYDRSRKVPTLNH